MSSSRDSETEVNEKLLNSKPYANSNNSHDLHPPHSHNNQQQQQQQKHNNHNVSNGRTPPNHNHNYQNAPHYQHPLVRLNVAGTSNPHHASTGSVDLKAAAAMQETTQYRFELERQLKRIKCYLLAMSIICLIFFVVVIITFSVLFVKFRQDLDNHTHKPKVGEQVAVLLQHKSMCVPCQEFTLGPSPEETRMLNTFSLKDSENGLTCCVDTPQELLYLLKMFIERRFRLELAKGTVRPRPTAGPGGVVDHKQPVAAHLLMTTQNMEGISQIQGRQYTIGEWIYEKDAAFTIGTSYQHGRIVIPHDGFYFVYSQISFMEYYTKQQKHAFDSRIGVDSPSLSHYLYRYNIHYHNGGEEKLAQNSITKCWGQSRAYGEYASYLGAVFYLRNQDEIFIKVSNISMVSTDPKLSYFGLFQI